MAGKKILVADDSLTIQKVIRLALSNEGYDIQAVSDGNDAIQQISVFRPDIVLIDVSLPGKTAFEVKRAVNQQTDVKRPAFILMSSAFERVDEAQVQEVGFEGRLTKPFDPAHLRKVLQDTGVTGATGSTGPSAGTGTGTSGLSLPATPPGIPASDASDLAPPDLPALPEMTREVTSPFMKSPPPLAKQPSSGSSSPVFPPLPKSLGSTPRPPAANPALPPIPAAASPAPASGPAFASPSASPDEELPLNQAVSLSPPADVHFDDEITHETVHEITHDSPPMNFEPFDDADDPVISGLSSEFPNDPSLGPIGDGAFPAMDPPPSLREPTRSGIPAPAADDTDIRNLTESTIKMSGLDDYEWSVKEPSLRPLPGMEDMGGSTFDGMHPTPPHSPSHASPAPAASAIPAPPPLSSLAPRSAPHSHEQHASPPEPQLEDMIRRQVEETLHRMAKEILPEIAERLIKQEIHRLLEDQG